MALSAGVKKLFGVIPGTRKPEYHFQYPDPARFAQMLVDLNLYFKPRLTWCDAVVAMEGNGPTQGTPRPIGCLLAAADPNALDLVCAHLMGLTPAQVPTLQAALPAGPDPVVAPGPGASLATPTPSSRRISRSPRSRRACCFAIRSAAAGAMPSAPSRPAA